MLVISRKVGEAFRINNAKVVIFQVSGNRVRIGIEAPRDVRVLREELGDTETEWDSKGKTKEKP